MNEVVCSPRICFCFIHFHLPYLKYLYHLSAPRPRPSSFDANTQRDVLAAKEMENSGRRKKNLNLFLVFHFLLSIHTEFDIDTRLMMRRRRRSLFGMERKKFNKKRRTSTPTCDFYYDVLKKQEHTRYEYEERCVVRGKMIWETFTLLCWFLLIGFFWVSKFPRL